MPGDYVEVQTDNIKSQFAALNDLHKSQAARLVLLKATQKLFGPFQNFYYKMVGNYRVVTKLLGINTQAQGAATKQTNLLSKATKLLLVPLRLFRLTSLLTIGTILSVIAVFAYLSTSFGSTANKTGVLMDALGRVSDSASNLIDTISGLDWSPILDPLISAFESVQGFLMDMIIISLNLFSILLDNMGGVVEGIREILLSVDFSPIIESFTLFGTAFVNMLSSIDFTPLINGLTTAIGEIGNVLASINFAGFIDTMTSLVPAVEGFVGLIIGIIFQLVSGIGMELLKLDLSPIIDLLSVLALKIATIDFSGMDGGIDYIIGLLVELTSEMVTVVNTVVSGVSDMAIMLLGLDWSPITDMLILAFGLIAHLVGTFLISATKAFGELFAIFTQLVMYLGDVGVFQQLIDITGMLFAAVIFGFASIFIALDQLGINWDSIFGLIIDLVAGLANFLMDSGIIPFFVDLIQYVVLLLTVFTFVIGGILILWADAAAYIVGPLWTIFTTVIGGIVDMITIAIGLVLGVVSIGFKLMIQK